MKISKIGVTALAGALATVSAVNAGEMTVTGSATMTYIKLGHGETGNPMGMQSNLSFAGSGELDGGQTFKLAIDNTDKNVYSAADLSLTTNSIGTFNLNQAGGGGGIGGYDDNMPRAWEEVWDTGVGGGADLAKGVGSSMHVQWKSPKFLDSTTLILAWTADEGLGAVNDKSVGGAVGHFGEAYDAVLDIDTSMVDMFVGYSNTDRGSGGGDSTYTGAQTVKDKEQGVVGLKLAYGPVTVGAQRAFEHYGNQVVGQVEYYANSSYGLSFNINDDLSVSYGFFQSRKGFISRRNNPTVILEGESFQMAYTMGGASIKIADTEVDNASYTTTAAAQKSGTSVALSLAF